MRSLRLMVLLVPLALAACGRGEDRTVVVNPQQAPTAAPAPTIPPGSTVIVPQSNTVTRVCPPGMVTC